MSTLQTGYLTLPMADGSSGTATTTPSTPPAEPDPNSVTAGVGGFVVLFLLAVVTWLLLRNMTRRLRRMRYREQEQALLDQQAHQEREQRGDGGDHRPDDGADPSR